MNIDENRMSKLDEKDFNQFCENVGWNVHNIKEMKNTKRPDRLLKIKEKEFIVEIKSLIPNTEESEQIEKNSAGECNVYSDKTYRMRRRVDNPIQSAIKQFSSFKKDYDKFADTPTILVLFDHRSWVSPMLIDIISAVLFGDPTIVIAKESNQIIDSHYSNNYNDWISTISNKNKQGLENIDIIAEYKWLSKDEGSICFFKNPHSAYEFDILKNLIANEPKVFFKDWETN